MIAADIPVPERTDEAVTPWRLHLGMLVVACAAILLVFRNDVADMVSIWWNSSTFNHCLIILPIIGWLVWNRREELSVLTPGTSYLGLGIVAVGAMGWMLGEAAGVSFARHFGLVVIMQGSVIAILGRAVAQGLAFPLFYAFFLVPFGEEFVPFLQMITAELSMVLLGLFGLPAHIEGVFITTPSGYFEVAEACSGVKFLIAMVALGALAANLCFKSWPKRLAFLGVCVIVPIVANGIRAFGTIYIADTSGIAFAESFDHVVYGWFFFAFVIAAILAIGWKFFDRDLDDPAFDPADIARGQDARTDPLSVAKIAASAVLIAVLPMAWMSVTSAAAQAGATTQISLPEVEGWNRSGAPHAYPWQANYDGADRLVQARYHDDEGRTVDLAIAYYAYQDEGREVAGFGQGGHPPETEWSWVEDTPAPPSGTAYRITAPGPVVREVFQYMRVGGAITGSATRAKLHTMRVRLLGGDQSAIGVVISAEGRSARDAMEAFLADAGGIERLVDRAPGLAD